MTPLKQNTDVFELGVDQPSTQPVRFCWPPASNASVGVGEGRREALPLLLPTAAEREALGCALGEALAATSRRKREKERRLCRLRAPRRAGAGAKAPRAAGGKARRMQNGRKGEKGRLGGVNGAGGAESGERKEFKS